MSEKVSAHHLRRKAVLYVRQSSAHQVTHHQESKRLQYAMKDHLTSLGWRDIEVIDEDLGRSAATATGRTGFQRMVADVGLGKVGAACAREVSRFARNNRDWHQLVEMCGLVDTLLVDHESVYDARQSNIDYCLDSREVSASMSSTSCVSVRWKRAGRRLGAANW